MLYKNIIVIPLTQLLLTDTAYAATIAVYSSATNNNTLSCQSAKKRDTCEFYCDTEFAQQFQSFDCGNAGECKIFCEQKECMKYGTLTASNSDFLQITSPGSNCLQRASIYISSGNASINTGFNGLTQTNIYTGQNTQNIYIDCDSSGNGVSDCQGLSIHAQYAQFLEIFIGDGKLENALINCPVNSAYNGHEEAPCIIYGAGHGMLLYSQIVAANGIPQDFFISGISNYTDVTLQCSNGLSEATTVGFTTADLCWHNHSIIGTNTSSTTDTNQVTTLFTTTSTIFQYIYTATPYMPLSAHSGIGDEVWEYAIYIALGIVFCCVCCLCWMIGIKLSRNDNSKLQIESLSHISGRKRAAKDLSLRKRNSLSLKKRNSVSMKGNKNLSLQLTHPSMEIELTNLHVNVIEKEIENNINPLYNIPEHKDRVSVPSYTGSMQMLQPQDSISIVTPRTDTAQQKIRVWLLSEVALPEYYDAFIANGYDTMELIECMEDKKCLEEIGILLKGHQNKIWIEIKKLQQNGMVKEKNKSMNSHINPEFKLHIIDDRDEELYTDIEENQEPTNATDDVDDDDVNTEGI